MSNAKGMVTAALHADDSDLCSQGFGALEGLRTQTLMLLAPEGWRAARVREGSGGGRRPQETSPRVLLCSGGPSPLAPHTAGRPFPCSSPGSPAAGQLGPLDLTASSGFENCRNFKGSCIPPGGKLTLELNEEGF